MELNKLIIKKGATLVAPLPERETGFEPATSTLARLHSTTELFPHIIPLVRAKGVEPPHLTVLDPKSSVSASSTTLAHQRLSESYI